MGAYSSAVRILLALLPLSAAAQEVTLVMQPAVREAGALVVRGTVTNQIDTDVTNVNVVVRLQDGSQTVLTGRSDDTWSCRDNGTPQSVRCTAAVLRAKSSAPVTLTLAAEHGRWELTGLVTWLRGTAEGRSFASLVVYAPWDIRVTHDRDGGAGSLREAIIEANADCGGRKLPCRIVFDAPMTIRPLTALPVISGPDMAIDGGGNVALDGSLVSGGSGLEIDGAAAKGEIRGLAIRLFPWDGVHVKRGVFVIAGNVIEANASRGVTSAAPIIIENNLIRWHGRSGVFITGESAYVRFNDVEENGASGVFLANEWGVANRNRIRNNAHFGVAVPRFVMKSFVSQNSMSGNRISGFDRGLDGADGSRHDEADLRNAYIPPPRLTSAVYDPATNTTTIRGAYFNYLSGGGTWEVELFATTAPQPQGETYLGEIKAVNGQFALRVEGDLRGRYITATGNRQIYVPLAYFTSEFADVVEVR